MLPIVDLQEAEYDFWRGPSWNMVPLEAIPEVDIYSYWIVHVLVVTTARPRRAKGFHDGLSSWCLFHQIGFYVRWIDPARRQILALFNTALVVVAHAL